MIEFGQQLTIIAVSLGIIIFIIITLPFLSWIRFRKTNIPSISKINLKILKKLSEDKKRYFSLEEILSEKELKKSMESINWLKDKKWITQRRNLIKITRKGLEKLIKHYFEESKNNLKLQETYIGILLTILTIIILYTTLQLQVVQIGIMESSNAPLQATLEFIPDKDDLVIPAFQLSESRNLDYPEGWGQIGITILNFGQMDSNNIHCSNRDHINEIWAYLKPESNFKNIPSGSSTRTTLHLRYIKCQKDNRDFCDKPELIPLGMQNITLECECYGCKNQRNFEVPINFCIYNENESICEGFLN